MNPAAPPKVPPDNPLDAALAYAARGWPVFPCNPVPDPPGCDPRRRRAKAPLVAGADRDAARRAIPHTGGLWRATTDAQAIRAWWRRHPRALVGVPTGARIGAFVIDLDPKGESLADVEARLVAAVGPLPAGPRSITQSGGAHLWFRLPEGEAVPRNSAKRLAGIDWRGDGGYVIAPPSRMTDGAAYRWAIGLDAAALPEPPAALLDLVYQRGAFARGRAAAEASGDADAGEAEEPSAPARVVAGDDPAERAVRRYALAALDRARADVCGARPGTRGHTLNAVAFGLAPFVALGVLSEREAVAALRDGADACGLTRTDGVRERDAKIRRGLDAGAGNTADLARRLGEIRAEARRRAERWARPPAPSAPPAELPPLEFYVSPEADGRATRTHASCREPAREPPAAPGLGGADRVLAGLLAIHPEIAERQPERFAGLAGLADERCRADARRRLPALGLIDSACAERVAELMLRQRALVEAEEDLDRSIAAAGAHSQDLERIVALAAALREERDRIVLDAQRLADDMRAYRRAG